jgi:hypothetical protein
MILYDSSMWPQLTLHFRASDWNLTDYLAFNSAFTLLLDRAERENIKIKLFIQGSVDNNVPPVSFYAWVIADVLANYKRFKVLIDKTAIYTPNNALDLFFEMLFKVYKPSRPMQRFMGFDDAIKWLYER